MKSKSTSPGSSPDTQEITTDKDMFFPVRPDTNHSGAQIQLCSNYFPIVFQKDHTTCFQKYAVDFSPELPGDSANLRRRLFTKAKKEITEAYGMHFFNNTVMFCQNNIEGEKTFNVEWDSQNYVISIKWVHNIEQGSSESLPIYKRFLFSLIGKLGMIPFKKNFFDKGALQNLDQIEIWPGFNPSINILNNQIVLNIFALSKVIRTENALDFLNKLRKNNSNNAELQDQARELMKNMTLLTRYNNDKTFTISDIDFNMNPQSTFETKDGPITFIDYYKKKYNKTIQNTAQPLLVSIDKKTKRKLHLIPEFCFMTGLTEEMRGNFNFMKQVTGFTIGTAQGKMTDCLNIVKRLTNSPEASAIVKEWGLTISENPINFTARKLDPGKMQQKTNNFMIEGSNDIDRKVQCEMYSATPLNKWLIAYSRQVDDLMNKSFLPAFQQCLTQFKFPMNKPRMVMMNSTRYPDWEKELRGIFNQCSDVEFALLIVPGSRGKGFFYSEIKAMLTKEYGVPSQVILEGTMKKDKGLRSVLNKVLIQICAKTNGQPWVINDLPYSNQPTMIMSFYTYKGILTSCGTVNQHFSQYSSKAVEYKDENQKDLSKKIRDMTGYQVNEFKKRTGVFPANIIVLREGIAPSDHELIVNEINAIHGSIHSLNSNSKMSYILMNTKHNLKAVQAIEQKKYTNIPSGTLIDTDVVGKDFEFYLVSQKSNQGISQGTQYKVIFDEIKLSPDKLHLLIYKLCFLYYNWTGGIKGPAPAHYAKKLAFQIGDKTVVKNQLSLPHEKLSSLFFI